MINKIKFFAAAMAFVGLISSCGGSGGFETTDAGLQYRIIKEGDGPKPADSQYMVVNLVVKNHKDSIIFASTQNGRPEIFQYYDSLSIENGGIEEALGMIKKGDSIDFKVMADTVYKGMMMPPGVEKGTFLTINMKMEEVLDADSLRAWQMGFMMKKRMEAEKAAKTQIITDKKIINDYLVQNNIVADSTASGLRYVIKQAGNGPNALAGQNVSVHYTGTLLSGKKFDSSVDKGQPFTFTLGRGQVIKGWDEGIALLNKGAKATFYIPSTLAYGARAAGPEIPANSVLVFEVELIDFK